MTGHRMQLKLHMQLVKTADTFAWPDLATATHCHPCATPPTPSLKQQLLGMRMNYRYELSRASGRLWESAKRVLFAHKCCPLLVARRGHFGENCCSSFNENYTIWPTCVTGFWSCWMRYDFLMNTTRYYRLSKVSRSMQQNLILNSHFWPRFPLPFLHIILMVCARFENAVLHLSLE